MWSVSRRQAESLEQRVLLAHHVMEGRTKLNKPKNKSKNNPKLTDTGWGLMRSAAPWMICALWGIALPADSAPVANKQAAAVKQATPPKQSIPPCKSVQIGKSSVITLGKVEILPLSVNTKRIFVGGLPSGYVGKPEDIKEGEPGKSRQATGQTSTSTGVADVDVVLLSPRELYLLGKKNGTMNVILQGQDDQCTVIGVTVAMDAAALQDRLGQLIPGQKGIKVSAVENSFILTGTVSDAVKVEQAVTLAKAYTGSTSSSNVVNMLQVSAPQQVMLEVKMAEVSKNLLDKLGAQFSASRRNGDVAYAIASGFLALTGSATKGVLTISHNHTSLTLDAQDKDGVVKILAEPNIIAISGQEGSFLAGGKIFIPVSQSVTGGIPTISLEEKEFGIGLKFTPTVLEDGLINLRVAPEVSELSQTGIAITSGSNASILPSFTTRRATTTVQLRDGQSFAIAGLIKNNVTETITRFPILGSIPILGALFRSTEFQNDKTELLFVVTPRLVKPLPPDYKLPTDNFIEPTKKEFFIGGKLEGKPAEPAAPAPMNPAPATPAPNGTKPESADPGGFEMK
jgi:pilus assembly protein CpaC